MRANRTYWAGTRHWRNHGVRTGLEGGMGRNGKSGEGPAGAVGDWRFTCPLIGHVSSYGKTGT